MRGQSHERKEGRSAWVLYWGFATENRTQVCCTSGDDCPPRDRSCSLWPPVPAPEGGGSPLAVLRSYTWAGKPPVFGGRSEANRKAGSERPKCFDPETSPEFSDIFRAGRGQRRNPHPGAEGAQCGSKCVALSALVCPLPRAPTFSWFGPQALP